MKIKHTTSSLSKRLSGRLGVITATGIILIIGAIYIFNIHSPISISVKISRNKPVDNNQADKTVPSNKQLSYGIVTGNILSLPTSERAADLKQIKDAGFSEVRIGFDWNSMEAVQGKYDWKTTDIWLQAIKTAGLKPIIQIGQVPQWNRPAACKNDPYCAPVDSSYFGKFAGAAAARYRTYNVAAWEIWNEENGMNFWKPIPNPNQYAHLLASAYGAIKKSDPNSTVLLGGLSGDSVDKWGSTFMDPRTFLAQVYAANVKDSFDAIGYHPYIVGFGLPDEKNEFNGWAKMAAEAYSIRSIMKANNDENKHVWITEFGVTTGGKGVAVTEPGGQNPKGSDHASLDAQAKIAQAAIDSIKQSPWIGELVWYSYKDDTTAATNPGAGYGIWQNNGQPKPALKILQDAMRKN